ncbi:MAG: hypothetical protein HOY79_55055 [Streptomyces sp.]|nr:hypothetical protein [Streptomyces sp.]
MNTGSAQERLLSAQRAYYSALAPDYLDQLLDLPGGAELNEALDAFRPAGQRPGTSLRSRLPGPVLLDVLTNPDEIAVPAKPTVEQGWGFAVAKVKEIVRSHGDDSAQ